MRTTAHNGMEINKVVDVNTKMQADDVNIGMGRQTKGKNNYEDLHSMLKKMHGRKDIEHFINYEDKMYELARLTQGRQVDAGMDLNFREDSDSDEEAVIDFDAGEEDNLNDKEYENFGIIIYPEDNFNVGMKHKNEEKQKRF